jgi:hypothetical protein
MANFIRLKRADFSTVKMTGSNESAPRFSLFRRRRKKQFKPQGADPISNLESYTLYLAEEAGKERERRNSTRA